MTLPPVSVLDKRFRYTPSGSTSVEATWRRYGWRPVSDEERRVKIEEQRSAWHHCSADEVLDILRRGVVGRIVTDAFLADEDETKGGGRDPAE